MADWPKTMRLSECEKWARDSIIKQCSNATDDDLEGYMESDNRQFWIDAIMAEQERRRSPGIDIANLIWTVRDTA